MQYEFEKPRALEKKYLACLKPGDLFTFQDPRYQQAEGEIFMLVETILISNGYAVVNIEDGVLTHIVAPNVTVSPIQNTTTLRWSYDCG